LMLLLQLLLLLLLLVLLVLLPYAAPITTITQQLLLISTSTLVFFRAHPEAHARCTMAQEVQPHKEHNIAPARVMCSCEKRLKLTARPAFEPALGNDNTLAVTLAKPGGGPGSNTVDMMLGMPSGLHQNCLHCTQKDDCSANALSTMLNLLSKACQPRFS